MDPLTRFRRFRTIRLLVLAAALSLVTALAVPALAATGPHWRIVHLGGPSDLRALSPVSDRVAWASGSWGVVLRTADGGRTWKRVGPPNTAALQFRGLKAFDATTAVIMSVGDNPGDFRIYRTTDGGAHWQLTNRNQNAQAFYDCMTFFDSQRGLVLSDPVNGKFRILVTTDGGRTWRINPPKNMPAAHPGEFAFAASNTCITTVGRSNAWFGTGGPTGSRVFRSTDGGRTWTVQQTPIRRGETYGIYSVAFKTPFQGFAIGGDFATPKVAPQALALTADGGRTWTLVDRSVAPGEYRSGAAWVPGRSSTAVAVGPTGSDITMNGGFRWWRFDSGSFDAVMCTPDGSCWASGDNERIGKLLLG